MNNVLWWLFQTSVTATALVLAVAVVCRCLRRWPAMQHALWVVVLFKLLTPPVVNWPWTASDAFPSSTSQEFAFAIVGERANPSQLVDTDSSDSAPAMPPDERVDPPDVKDVPATVDERPAESKRAPAATPWSRAAIPALFGFWLLGGLVALIWQMQSAVRARRAVAKGRAASDRLQQEVQRIAERMGTTAVPTRVLPGISSPFVCCFGRPLLVWPESLCDDSATYRSVIAHELAHVKRRDHWVAWLVLVATCLWWWNPLFWFLRRQLAETGEMACDALALSILPAERTQFAKALLHLSQRVAETKTPAPALGAGTGKRQTFRRRFSMILNERVNAKLPKAGIVAALLLAGVALPAWALRAPAGDSSSGDGRFREYKADPLVARLQNDRKVEETDTAPHVIAAASKTGTLTGVIKYDDEPPKPKLLHKKGDPNVKAPLRRFDIPDESLLVEAKSRGIANVVVYLRKKPAGYHAVLPKKAAVFTIKNGRFSPHVLFVRSGQTVSVRNADNFAHSVHSMPLASPAFNHFVAAGRRFEAKYGRGDRVPVKVVSDLFPSMRAWHVVLDHPFAAVTDKNGRFTIPGLPAGKYRFVIWHEKSSFLDRSYDVVIKPGKTETLSLSYEPKRFK